jgi:hypothetical protein
VDLLAEVETGGATVKSTVSLCAFILSLGLTLFVSPAYCQDLGGGVATKENLDLPFDSIGESEEEEDAPEIVTFYGQQLEGDGIFYVIDRSSSMGDRGELAIAKTELARNSRSAWSSAWCSSTRASRCTRRTDSRPRPASG